MKAVEVKVPLVGIKPLDDDDPKVKDDWERARQRQLKALEERNKLLEQARKHLVDAVTTATACLEWRPEYITKGEKKETAATAAAATTKGK